MKRLFFVIYTWGTTLLFGFLILWLASIPNFKAGNSINDDFIKLIFRIIIYSILFILIYRSIILTVRSIVEDLAKYRNKQEKSEDLKFVLLIETLIVILTMSLTLSFAFFEEYTQIFTPGRNGSEFFVVKKDGEFISSNEISLVPNNTYINIDVITESSKDILISTLSILITSMIVFSMPEVGDFEITLKKKLKKLFKKD